MSNAQLKVKGLVVWYDSTCEGKIEFKLGDGQVLDVSPDDMNQDIQRQAMYHGFNQKIRDAASGFDLTGKKGTPDFDGAFEAMQLVIESLTAGDWNRKAGGGNSNMKYLAAAIAQMKGVEVEKAQMVVDKADDATKKTWLASAKVKAAIADIISKQAQAKAEQAEEELDFGIEMD
jgi:hypothetical protein